MYNVPFTYTGTEVTTVYYPCFMKSKDGGHEGDYLISRAQNMQKIGKVVENFQSAMNHQLISFLFLSQLSRIVF